MHEIKIGVRMIYPHVIIVKSFAEIYTINIVTI